MKRVISIVFIVALLFHTPSIYAATDDIPNVFSNVDCSTNVIKGDEEAAITFSSGGYDSTIVLSLNNELVHSFKTTSTQWTFKPEEYTDDLARKNHTTDGAWKIKVFPNSPYYNYGDSCDIAVIRPVVIFIPGIMGTELKRGSASGDTVWMPDPTLGVNVVDDDVDYLAMNADGTSKHVIYADKPLDAYYGEVTKYLRNNFDVIEFGYDWRLPVSENADKLADLINGLDYRFKPVNIVAHSMGGLIATSYIAKGNKSKVHRLITLGTPYLGAPKALIGLESGDITDSNFKNVIINDPVQRIAGDIPGIYELLPNRKYFSSLALHKH